MRERPREITLFHNRLALLLLAGVCIFLMFAIFDLLPKEMRARSAAKEAEIRRDTLEERSGLLAARIAELETPRGQEAYVRKTRDVARDGEEVIMVLAETGESEKNIDPLPWYRRVMGWFGK
jgi:Tfp pilus assembly protein PilN